jgi:hypothetical protein
MKLTGMLRYNIADGDAVRVLAMGCSARAACTFLRALAKARGLAQHPLNTRLFFEDLLIQYRELTGAGAGPATQA